MNILSPVSSNDPRERLIVALDVPDCDEARKAIAKLGDSVIFYKIGMELIYHGGLDLAKELKAQGKKIFIDAKLHDIPRTVLSAARNIEKFGADIVTLHCNASCYRALEQYRKENQESSMMKWCFVTVLTSDDEKDLLQTIGIHRTACEHVLEVGQHALAAGADGLVASVEEARMLREKYGTHFTLITPGIRPAGTAQNDQKRTATPEQAIQAGADYLVVGRPILQAENPKEAADAIVDEIAEALKNRQQYRLDISHSPAQDYFAQSNIG